MKRLVHCGSNLWNAKGNISFGIAPKNDIPTNTSKHALVANPGSRAMAPEKCHCQVKSRDGKHSESIGPATKFAKHEKTVQRKTQWNACKQTS